MNYIHVCLRIKSMFYELCLHSTVLFINLMFVSDETTN